MKRPNLASYIFGNPISLIALLWTGYDWWNGAVSGWLPLLVLIAVSYGYEASNRIQKFNAWKREWEAMEGRVSVTSRMGQVSSRIIGIAIFCLAAIYAFSTEATPEIQIARGLLISASFVMITGMVLPRIWRRLHHRTRRVVDVPVKVCVDCPRQPSALASAFGALPDYCISLITAKK